MLADLSASPKRRGSARAIHSEVGKLTLRQLLNHAVRHLEEHVESIAEKRTAMGL